MMLNRTTFAAELRRFPRTKSSAMRALLDRWSDDPRAEDVWQKVRDKSEDRVTAEQLIRAVLKAYMDSRALVARAEHYIRDRDHWIKTYQASVTKVLRSDRELSDIAQSLETMAAGLRDIDEFYSTLLPADLTLRRKNQNNSRIHTIFFQRVGEFFNEHCGQWMDDEVATLAEISFETEFKTAQVRAVRKATTTAERRTTQH